MTRLTGRFFALLIAATVSAAVAKAEPRDRLTMEEMFGEVGPGSAGQDRWAEIRFADALNMTTGIGNAPVSYRADYGHVILNLKATDSFNIGIGFESLGGDEDNSGEAFRTPLATLHAFQGWADQFLATPDAGINDVYGMVGYKIQKWKLTAVYHDFSAQDGSADWGSEFDISFGRKLGDRYGILLKGAFFNANHASYTDTTKLWLQLTAGF